MKTNQGNLEKAIRAIKIEVDPGEQDKLGRELESFLQWLEPLLAVDTAAVQPVLLAHGEHNVLREDRAEPAKTGVLQRAAPNFEDGFYKVPPIME